MTYHLKNTRACIQRAAQAPDLGMKISWLTLICKQILNHLEMSESAKPVTEHLIGARKSVTAASLTTPESGTIAWLIDACKQILNHLESPQGDNKLPQGEMDERPEPETDPRLQKLLDQTQFGDLLTITNRRGKHLSNISGPVLSDQAFHPGVGIDLLDGDPYIVRDEAGIVWAPIAYATLCRDGGLVAMWVEDADH